MARTRTSRRGRNAIETPTLASGKLVWSVPIWHENPHLADLLPQRRKRTSFRVARDPAGAHFDGMPTMRQVNRWS
jgi:hypothetical protein